MEYLPGRYLPGCTGKVGIDSEAHAREGARRKDGRAPYRCQHCGQWHTGSMLGFGGRDRTRMEPYRRPAPGMIVIWEDDE